MACGETRVWTFCTLVGAFLDLTIALLLLCCSTITYLVSSFLSVFGLALPCPCHTGLFGAPSRHTCHFVDGPISRIGSVQMSVWTKPPFDSIVNPKVGFLEREESSCGSSFRYSSRKKIGFVGGTPPAGGRVSWLVGKSGGGGEEEEEEGVVRVLERALEEEQSARSALYVELEKERSAAATAAEEAMAMIHRLQKEKAVVEMNARQYQRMVEEKSAYDEEEMEVLKEIILRRERELYVLGKEVEVYRKGVVSGEMDGAAPRSSFESEDDDTSAMLQEICNSILKKGKVRINNENEDADQLAIGEEAQSLRLPEETCFPNPPGGGNAHYPDMFACADDENQDFQEKGIVSVSNQDVEDVCKLWGSQEHGFHQEISCFVDELCDRRPNKMKDRFPCDDVHSANSSYGERRIWNDPCASHPESETFDVHVIGDELMLSGEGNQKEKDCQVGSPLVSSHSYDPPFELHGIRNIEISSDHSSINQRGAELNILRGSYSEKRMKCLNGSLIRATSSLDGSIARAIPFNSKRNSISIVDNERSKLEIEVEGLRRRLDIIQQGREKLSFSVEHMEKENVQLQLLQEIAFQLRELHQLSELDKGIRQASLPPPSSQVKSKNRRCKSMSSGGSWKYLND